MMQHSLLYHPLSYVQYVIPILSSLLSNGTCTILVVELTNLLRAMHRGMAYIYVCVCVCGGGVIVTEVNLEYGSYMSTLLVML